MGRAKLALATVLVGLTAAGSLIAGAPAAQAAASGCVAHNYSKGDTHECVRKIQKILNGVSVGHKVEGSMEAGCGKISSGTIDADAVFGSATVTKVKNFQRAKCLSDDGVVGSNTWLWLCEEIATLHWYPKTPDATVNAGFKAAKDSGCGSVVPYYYS